jgi:transcriptional regulator with XRE-family HTH domain
MTSKAATEFDRRVGARIMMFREVKNLSQRALGLALGVTKQQIQKYEKGRDRIRANRLCEIARCLGVTISLLLGENIDGDEEHGSPALYCLPGAMDLLKAFIEIENVELRGDILALVRTVARLGARSVAESS